MGELLAKTGYMFLDGVEVLDPPQYYLEFDPGTLWKAGIYVYGIFQPTAPEITLRIHGLRRTTNPLQIMWCDRIGWQTHEERSH